MRRAISLVLLMATAGLSLSGCWRDGRDGRPGYPGGRPHHGHHDGDHDDHSH